MISWLTNDKMDPYVTAEFGGERLTSKTCSDGHTAPNFFNEQLVLWSGESKKKIPDWTQPIKFKLFDNDFGRDYVIGEAELDLLQYFSLEQEQGNRTRSLDIFKKGREAGVLVYKLDFIPAGVLNCWVKGCSNLRSTELVGSQDPYCVITLTSVNNSKANNKVKTKTHSDGGRNPIFGEMFKFDIVDVYEMSIQVYDEDFGKDDLIGETVYSFIDVIKVGGFAKSCTIPIAYKGKPAGDVNIVMSFDVNPVQGTPYEGFRYPGHVPMIETFEPPVNDNDPFKNRVGAMRPEKVRSLRMNAHCRRHFILTFHRARRVGPSQVAWC